MKKYTAYIVTAIAAVAPFLASAQVPKPTGLPTTVTQIATFFSVKVVGFLGMIFWALTGVFIIWAAFLYLTGAGNEEKIGKAKQILIYAIIAAVVAFFAQVGLGPLVTSLF